MNPVNLGRAYVSNALSSVVKTYFGRTSVSEIELRNAWLEEIGSVPYLTTNGWYDPPMTGAVILACSSSDVRRTHFRSFRDRDFCSSDRAIDWSDGIIIAYASNVDRVTGIPADFATTAYFGSNPGIRRHLTRCFTACREALAGINVEWNANELYAHVHTTMLKHELDGKTWSTTDNGYNYGHTLPSLVPSGSTTDIIMSRELATDLAVEMRNARRFLSESASWKIADGEQFTIEPQCISPKNHSLPKVMIHYVAMAKHDTLSICDRCELLPRELGLQ